MRTTKPISTISFNTPLYLKERLYELQQAKKISVWHFVRHFPEDDEAGKKEHIHLYIEPSKLIQTEDLKEYFKEIDFENPEKPKKCLPFRSSKFGDWYLYSIHDRAYLASKGQARRYHYEKNDVITSDEEELNRAVHTIDRTTIEPIQLLQDAIEDGRAFTDLIKAGQIPIQQIRNYKLVWEMLLTVTTYRGRQEERQYKTCAQALTSKNADNDPPYRS